MISDLGVSHCDVEWMIPPNGTENRQGFLGCQVSGIKLPLRCNAKADAYGYQIIKIDKGQSWCKRKSGPLAVFGVRSIVKSGDVIVADRDGVVVVPYSKIDFVINRLSQVADLEYSLDAEVRGGLKIPDPVKEMILDDNVKFVDD